MMYFVYTLSIIILYSITSYDGAADIHSRDGPPWDVLIYFPETAV